MKQAVHFGAGNIGRGFIGRLLSQSGYQVVFVDVYEPVVRAINKTGKYQVCFAADDQPAETVQQIRALTIAEEAAVAAAVAEAEIVTTAVGPTILPKIAPLIATGLQLRAKQNNGPLPIIACENMIGNSSSLGAEILKIWPAPKSLPQVAFFPDCAVDCIVPLQRHADILQVTVEPFHEWVVDRQVFKQAPPPIKDVVYVDDLPLYIERKLFTVNTGHCCLAYLGYLAGHQYIHEAVADPAIFSMVHEALAESGAGLVKKYGITVEAHRHYLEKSLSRFANRHLPDEVTRVGRSPLRKLSANDRLVAPARLALAAGVEPRHLAHCMAAALCYDFAEDPEAVILQDYIRQHGVPETLQHFSGLPAGDPLQAAVLQAYARLKRQV